MANVLIVEDDRDSGEAVRRMMEKTGHRATVVPNGREALAAVSGDPTPDVIVLDLRMPVMDGLTFLQVLRSYLRWQDLPVIVVTAVGPGFPELANLAQYGVSRVFHKSNYDLADLAACVDELLAC